MINGQETKHGDEKGETRSPLQVVVHSAEEATGDAGSRGGEHFEVLAADCLNRLPFERQREFALRFLTNVDVSNYSKLLALADRHQSSMMCPWSSYPHGAVALQQEDGSKEKLSLNTIAFQVSADNQMMTMTFRAEQLPLGEVAIPRCRLESKTRSGPKTVDLDPANFLNALRRVSFNHLLENCEEDKSQFTVTQQEHVFRLGELRSNMEDQNVEYKYSEETWDFEKFVQKSFNKYLIHLLNGGAIEKDVELWLGVDSNGRNVGGSATVDSIRTALLHANLDCFPPVLKKDITIEVYPLEVPSPQEFVVEWFATPKEAHTRILDLKGRGWQVNGTNTFGVVIEKQAGKADLKASDVSEELLMKTKFERVICCVKVRSLFREAYINRHTEFGSLLPFDVWLRSRKNLALSFLDGLLSSSNVGFQLGGQSLAVEGICRFSSDDLFRELLNTLAKNPKKSRFVVFSLRSLSHLLELIRLDFEQQAQSVHFYNSLTSWNVAPMLDFGSGMEALATVKTALQVFSQVTVVEVLCEGFSYRAPETKPGKFSKRNSFEVVGVKLPEYEVLNYKEDADQFLFPESPHNDISWAIAEYYVVPTTMVQQVVELVDRAVRNQVDKRVIHVVANVMYSGLSSTLKKAAMICAEKLSQACSVLFLRDVYRGLDLSDLEQYLTSEKAAGRKCVIFQDAYHANPEYDNALASLLNAREYCCLVKGSCNMLYYETKPDVAISCVWDADDIRAYRDIFAKLSQSVVVNELDAVVEEAARQGCYPFFVLPLVVRHGKYIPIKTRMEEQARIFEDALMSDIAECLAFVSATCEESRVQPYLGFSRVMDDADENLNRHNLLKVLDRRGTRTFVHPEAGRVYIWVLLKNQLPSKEQERFPLDAISSFFKQVVTYIERLPLKPRTGLLQEICFERGTGSFSPFSSFLLRHPALLDAIYTPEFLSVLKKVIPPCDIFILMSRLSKYLERYDNALNYALQATETVLELRNPDYRKAKSNLASVYLARYRASRLQPDYDGCRECLEELIRIESDKEKIDGFKKRLKNLAVLGTS